VQPKEKEEAIHIAEKQLEEPLRTWSASPVADHVLNVTV
jgi:hypothetical protein